MTRTMIRVPPHVRAAVLATASWPFAGCAMGVDPTRHVASDASPSVGGSAGGSISTGGTAVIGTGGTLLHTGGVAPISQGGAVSSGGASAGGGSAGGGATGAGGSSGSTGGMGVSGSANTGGAQSGGCNDAAAIPLPPGCQPKPPQQCGSAESSCTSTAGCQAVLSCVACSGCHFANNCTACQSIIDQYGGVGGPARAAADNVLSCHGC